MKNKNFLAMLAFLTIFAATPVVMADDANAPAVEETDAHATEEAKPTSDDANATSSDTPNSDTNTTEAPTETVKGVRADYKTRRMELEKEEAQKLVTAGLADNEEAAMKMLNKKHKEHKEKKHKKEPAE